MRVKFRFVAFSSLILFPVLSFAVHWQGPYVGAYLGGGIANNQISTNTGNVTDSSYFPTTVDVNAVSGAGSVSNTPNSAIAGIQAGHDWVWQQMIYGVVIDYGAMPLHTSNTVNKIYPDNSSTYSVYTSMSTNWLMTLRGRVGYETVMHWPSLAYFTAGMAIAQLRVNTSFNDNSPLLGRGGSNSSQNQIGWTAGLGVELATYEHVTFDIEYSYIKLPAVKVASNIANSAGGFGVPVNSLNSPFTTTGEFHASLIKLGVNYRFDE